MFMSFEAFDRKVQRLLEWLRTDSAATVFLVLALAANFPNITLFFHLVEPPMLGEKLWLTWPQAAAYALALEGFILMGVLRGKKRVSWFFAGVSIASLLVLYAMVGGTVDGRVYTFGVPLVGAVNVYSAMLGHVLVAFMLPVAVALYSHDVADGVHGEERVIVQAIRALEDEDRARVLNALSPSTRERLSAPKEDTHSAQPEPAQVNTQITQNNVDGLDSLDDGQRALWAVFKEQPDIGKAKAGKLAGQRVRDKGFSRSWVYSQLDTFEELGIAEKNGKTVIVHDGRTDEAQEAIEGEETEDN